MPHRWRTSLFVPDRALVLFLGAWAALTLLPFLPALLTPLPRSPYFPLCVEALVLVTAFGLLAGSLLLVPRLGVELIPQMAQNEFDLELRLPPGTPLPTRRPDVPGTGPG